MNEPNDQQRCGGDVDRDRIDEAAQAWFLQLTSSEPTAEDRARFDAWRAADPRHRAAYDELRTLWTDIEDLREAFAPAGAGDGKSPPPGRAEAPARRGTNGSRADRRLAAWGSLAAGVALLLVFTPDLATHLKSDHRTGVGEQARVALPDGSIAWLNTDTALSVEYSAAHRHISLLHGEAQFEVAKDADRPFAVTAHEGRSTALGTIFTVRDEQTGTRVTVSEGTVEVAAPLGHGGAPALAANTAVLRAGQQVSYGKGAPPGPVRRIDPAAAAAWRDGFIAIRNLPVADALAEIDRYRPGRIVLLADTDSLEPVTARLSIASIDNGLEALAATHGLTVTRLTAYLVFVR